MNGGPFRESRPVDRRVASRSEQAPVSRQQEDVQPQLQERFDRSSPVQPQSSSKSARRFGIPLLLAIVLIAAVIGWLGFSSMKQDNTAIDTSKYQGIWLVNGEIYFGKLEQLNSDYFKLSDVFYIKPQTDDKTDDSTENTQSGSTQNNFELFKLGKEEIHGPEDVMMIAKDQVLYYENLKSDGKVVQGIEKYNSSN